VGTQAEELELEALNNNNVSTCEDTGRGVANAVILSVHDEIKAILIASLTYVYSSFFSSFTLTVSVIDLSSLTLTCHPGASKSRHFLNFKSKTYEECYSCVSIDR